MPQRVGHTRAMSGAAHERKKMETLVECLSIVAVSIAAVLIVFVVGAAVVAVVEETGKDETISGDGAGENKGANQ